MSASQPGAPGSTYEYANATSAAATTPTIPEKKEKKILLLNGPNLNLLGTREPGIYGADTLPEIEGRAATHARTLGATLTAFQTNYEGALIERIHAAREEGVSAIVVSI